MTDPVLVMFSEVCTHRERFGHVNNFSLISPYAFHAVSSFSNLICIMLFGFATYMHIDTKR